MIDVEISSDYLMRETGTSEGTQVKYYKDDYWYKLDNRGNEGLVEYLVSKFLTFTDLSPSEYVAYEQVDINGRRGCRSRNFLKGDGEFVTFYRLYQNEQGEDLSKVIGMMDAMEERIEYTVRFIKESCGSDVTDYLKKIFTLDRIILNEDRHLNNLGLVYMGGRFAPAPIFDQGLSLLTANQSVNWRLPVEENVRRVVARPFSGSHEKMWEYFGEGFGVDARAVFEWLETEPDSKEKEVLEYQIRTLCL